MTVPIYLESDLLGSDSLTGSITSDSLSLSGTFQGNGLFTGFGDVTLEPLIGEGSFQGNATFVGTLSGSFDPTPIDGEGEFQGNATFIAAGTVIDPDPLSLSGDFFGIAYFTGDGSLLGTDPEPAIVISLSAILEGNDNLIGDGLVSDFIEDEEPASCAVDYDTETCSCVTI